ncbi:hypothetical protein QWI29_15995 [Mycolicibacterium neoaurum]|uniref:hypothetical protein n=1 Tax=Mycolicibacterium neoaurum TaxID=1795 RepID=UPI002672BAC9|nr:hypothetical protein [Mycolicibacterium neoaurum]MDO3401542.1 hypothetical protein [Mycolicibacterium neoaurum]
MVSTAQSQSRTRNFARVIGPYLAVVAIVATARSSEMASMLAQFTSVQVLSWVVGAIVLACGTAIVAFHQYWRTPAAVVVSVVGWLLVVRGVFLIAFPTVFASLADRVIATAGSWMWLYVVMALIGLYLTYIGWMPSPQRDVNPSEDAEGEMRHAA